MTFQNIAEDATVYIPVTTIDPATGAPVAPSSALTASDFAIHKNGSATEKATTNGLTVTSPFDSKTGCHILAIDTSNDTGDAGFWTAGSYYSVRIESSKTVGGVSIDGIWVPNGEFGIEFGVAGAIQDDTENIQSRIPAALVSGRMDVSVGAMQANVITAAATAADFGNEIAATVETYIVNEGDATAVMQAIADLIAADWVAGDASPLAIASAVWANGSRTLTSLSDVADLGWNSAWDAEVESEVSDALTAYNVVATTDSVTVGSIDTDGITADALATNAVEEIRNALLDRVLAGNHDTGGTIGRIMQYLTEMTEDDGGVRRYTENALEEGPGGGGGGGLGDGDLDDIATRVKSIAGEIHDATAGTYEMTAADTWTQQFEVTAPSNDDWVLAIKTNLDDNDEDAIALVSATGGLQKLNGEDTTAGWGSVSGDNPVTVTIESDATQDIPPGEYYLILKSLDAGADKTYICTTITVKESGINEITP